MRHSERGRRRCLSVPALCRWWVFCGCAEPDEAVLRGPIAQVAWRVSPLSVGRTCHSKPTTASPPSSVRVSAGPGLHRRSPAFKPRPTFSTSPTARQVIDLASRTTARPAKPTTSLQRRAVGQDSLTVPPDTPGTPGVTRAPAGRALRRLDVDVNGLAVLAEVVALLCLPGSS